MKRFTLRSTEGKHNKSMEEDLDPAERLRISRAAQSLLGDDEDDGDDSPGHTAPEAVALPRATSATAPTGLLAPPASMATGSSRSLPSSPLSSPLLSRKRETDSPSASEDWSIVPPAQGADVYETQLAIIEQQLVQALLENNELKTRLTAQPDTSATAAAATTPEATSSTEITTEMSISDEHERVGAPLRQWNLPLVVREFLDLFDNSDLDADYNSVSHEDVEPEMKIKLLKQNVKRFKRAFRPVANLFGAVEHVHAWRSPGTSALCALVYFFCALRGCLVSTLLFALLSLLLYNYTQIGRADSRMFGSGGVYDEPDTDYNLREKFQVVVWVARIVQNRLAKFADVLERVRNLIMWRQPQKTQRITTALTAALAISLVASFDLFSFLFALFVGYEFFLLSWLYHSFPKTLRFKGRFLRSLKTDAELTALQKAQEQEQQNPSTPTRATSGTSTQSALRRRLNRTPNNTTSGRASSRTHSESASSAPLDLSFIPIDSDLALRLAIPETELSALFVWKCLLINPQNKMKSRKGRLFLTHSYVIFQANQSFFFKDTSLDFALSLHKITSLEKRKPMTFLPGNGLSLSIQTETTTHLIGLFHRDQTYSAIMSQAESISAPLAQAPTHANAHTPTQASTEESDALTVPVRLMGSDVPPTLSSRASSDGNLSNDESFASI